MWQMMDLGEMLGLTPGLSWENFSPMAPEKGDANTFRRRRRP
jgi:hypothetical protein